MGENNIRGHLFISIVLAQVGAIEEGIDPGPAVIESAKKSAMVCYDLLRGEFLGVKVHHHLQIPILLMAFRTVEASRVLEWTSLCRIGVWIRTCKNHGSKMTAFGGISKSRIEPAVLYGVADSMICSILTRRSK